MSPATGAARARAARLRAILGVILIAAVLVLYFAFAGIRAVALLASGTPIAIVMGAAYIVLPVIGAWALLREILFGWRSTALVDRLDAEGVLPDDLGEAGPRGRPDRNAAVAAFDRYRSEAEGSPQEWRSWMRLGLVYDACGDRRRARAAIREAVALERRAR